VKEKTTKKKSVLVEKSKAAFIDMANKQRVETEIQFDGHPLTEDQLADSLVSFLHNNMEPKGESELRDEIQPLAASLLLPALSHMIDKDILSGEMVASVVGTLSIRHLMIWMMLMGYALRTTLEAEDRLTFHVKRIPITDEEIDELIEMEELSKIFAAAEEMGVDPETVIEEMKKMSIEGPSAFNGAQLPLTKK
jgi:hypothetical protein